MPAIISFYFLPATLYGSHIYIVVWEDTVPIIVPILVWLYPVLLVILIIFSPLVYLIIVLLGLCDHLSQWSECLLDYHYYLHLIYVTYGVFLGVLI